MEKRVNIRVEHVKHSKCRQEFLNRVKSNALLKKEAKAKGEFVALKRLPAQPRESRQVSIKGNVPQTLTALPCELQIILSTGTECKLRIFRRDHHLEQTLGVERLYDAWIEQTRLGSDVEMRSRRFDVL
jgi:hypothetical protein